MSKQIKLRFVTILVGIALLTGLLTGIRPGLAVPQRRAVAVPAARHPVLIAATNSVLKEISEIRELSILRAVRSATQSRPEIERMIIKNLSEDVTPAEIHATEITWKKLGLAPADFHYRQFLVKLLSEQVAGYYEPRSKQFFIADWIDLDAQKPVMAHELTHALQDQHFNLRRFQHWPKGDSDAEMAAHALIEGDAMLAMTLYIAHNPLGALSFLKSMKAGMAATQQLDSAPRALRESLLFPYMEGSGWATELYKRGGWSTVSRAFAELPKSTEQILHADKYFTHEPPVKVDLPDITDLLNARGSGAGVPSVSRAQDARATWKRVDYDVNGEWGYYLILDEFLKSSAESKRAASGWGGDRYEVYEGSSRGDIFLAQLSVWDTEKDAREFFEAYARRTTLRYPNAARLESPNWDVQTRNSKLETRNSYSWRTSEGRVATELRGARVLILEGMPDDKNVQTLAKALWQ